MLMQKFMSKVQKTESCWLWTGWISGGPPKYGYLNTPTKKWRAHRLSWQLFKGDLPKNLYVCHKCDIPTCVNPDHLFIGTAKENMMDCSKKNRFNNWNKKKTHCNNGHPLSGENLYTRPNGARNCRICSRVIGRRADKKRRSKCQN